MSPWLRVTMLTLVVLGGSLVAAPQASAEETRCVGAIGARTLDNVRVPQGKTCSLIGARVQGTIYVSANATLIARNVRVIGNVQAENHNKVVVSEGTRVGGSIQIDRGGPFKVVNSIVTGSIQVVSNTGASRLANNVVNADIQVFSHRNGIAIVNNRVDGNLQCKENVPRPTGGGNIVQGNKEDQCRRL